jgi:hypothetical protein
MVYRDTRTLCLWDCDMTSNDNNSNGMIRPLQRAMHLRRPQALS